MHMSKDLENKQEHVKLQNLSWIIQCLAEVCTTSKFPQLFLMLSESQDFGNKIKLEYFIVY